LARLTSAQHNGNLDNFNRFKSVDVERSIDLDSQSASGARDRSQQGAKGDATWLIDLRSYRVIKGIQIKHLVRTWLRRTQTGYHSTSVSHRILPTTSGIGSTPSPTTARSGQTGDRVGTNPFSRPAINDSAATHPIHPSLEAYFDNRLIIYTLGTGRAITEFPRQDILVLESRSCYRHYRSPLWQDLPPHLVHHTSRTRPPPPSPSLATKSTWPPSAVPPRQVMALYLAQDRHSPPRRR
jgi:hypothetical protein